MDECGHLFIQPLPCDGIGQMGPVMQGISSFIEIGLGLGPGFPFTKTVFNLYDPGKVVSGLPRSGKRGYTQLYTQVQWTQEEQG